MFAMNNATLHLAALPVLLLISTSLSGCGGDGRVPVSGTVTVDGQLLEGGAVNFRPLDAAAANTSGTDIEHGRFEIPAARGLKPGKYRVSFLAFQPSGRMIQDPEFGPVAEQVRVRFKESDTLQATVEQRGENRFDFVLTTVK
jgi:hypothetical protein